MNSECSIIRKKYDVITGWKGILALIIFSEHFGIMGLDVNTGYMAVECFFLISGFLLALSIEKYDIKDINPFTMIWKKMKKIYPYYLYGMILMFLYYFIFPYIKPNGGKIDISVNSLIGELLMLQKSSLFENISINGVDWYVSAYIISVFIILISVKLLRRKILYFIPSIIITYLYVSYMFMHGNYDVGYVYRIDGQLIRGLEYLYQIFKNDEVADIHGDLTIENIICEQSQMRDSSYYIIDPNTGNIHDTPNLDYAKLLQSLHGGYEFLMKTKNVQITKNDIRFLRTRTLAYEELMKRYKEYLNRNFSIEKVKSIFFHEVVHWLRLMPYKINKNGKRAVIFYTGLIIVLNEVIEFFEEQSNDEK